ncbi:MAG: thioredoxin family protein [bacterium]|nr:thioredoxin family protein [bacterium]
MRKPAFWTAAVLFIISTACSQPSNWSENYDKSLALAASSGKTLLINFTGSDWCPWCVKLEKEVFSQKAFQDYASTSLVLMKADFPKTKKLADSVRAQNQALADKYGVQGFPTIVLLNGKGEKISQTGYQEGGAEAYVRHLKSLIAAPPVKPADGGPTVPGTRAAGPQAPETRTPEPKAPAWSDDFNRALAEAKKTGKTLLVDFTGSDWCPWCIKLNDEVFSQKAFKDFAAANLVLMMADFPRTKKLPENVKSQNQTLAERFGVQGFPTIVLLKGDGTKIGETGYQPGGAEAYVGHLKSLIGQSR